MSAKDTVRIALLFLVMLCSGGLFAVAAEDLVTPVMTDGAPAAGQRVRQTAPEYAGTEVYHSLYLPADWKSEPGVAAKYPVIVEYTGNKFPPGQGSGEVKDANLGYGMSGGRQFIWVVMPYVQEGRTENAVTWWGDRQATIDYCKTNLPRICDEFGGDPEKVWICGFSRGAIGSSYIGLADDEIAALWKGMFTHDHFDGQKTWGYPDSDRESALKRLARLHGRPVLICGQNASSVRDDFLKDHLDLAEFTFLDVPTTEIFDIPEGAYLHPHTDLWMHRESEQRKQARAWLQDVLVGEKAEPSDADAAPAVPAARVLRKIIVSHSDENGVLQLYQIAEDGSARRKLTDSRHGCRMPACSPDGKKLVYGQQSEKGMALWISEIDGKNAEQLTEPGGNLVPSWLPDGKHIVWMIAQPKAGEDPSRNSQVHLMNTETRESRRLFTDAEQLKFNNSMPSVSPDGKRLAFVSDRNGHLRVWVSDLDGSNGKPISKPDQDFDDAIQAPIEQKVPAWSPDGKWIAHWEGVEMIHMSKFTGVENRERDQKIAATFHVWVVDSDGRNRRKAGRGDDPTWSPDGFVTRAFPDQQRGGPKVMVETDNGEKELPIVPRGSGFGRFCWVQ